MRIGTIGSTYLEQRNIIGAVRGAEYRLLRSSAPWSSRVSRLTSALGRRYIPLDGSIAVVGASEVDVIHAFNGVVWTRKPWVLTFETQAPRLSATLDLHHDDDPDYGSLRSNRRVRALIERLAADNCLGLVALSACTLQIEMEMLGVFPEGAIIASRSEVIHPPQPRVVQEWDEYGRSLEGPIEFLFVGRDFYRKGGAEIVKAFGTVAARRRDVRLTLIGDLQPPEPGVYGAHPDDVEHSREIRQWIERNASWVTHFTSLPNDRVLGLVRRAHVGLLPTRADTYGFSVLEMQAGGCPVVTTDLRALPEINHADCGWVIEVPKNRLGESRRVTAQDRRRLSETIVEGLIDTLSLILDKPNAIPVKAECAMCRIDEFHDPVRFGERLRSLYDRRVQT